MAQELLNEVGEIQELLSGESRKLQIRRNNMIEIGNVVTLENGKEFLLLEEL